MFQVHILCFFWFLTCTSKIQTPDECQALEENLYSYLCQDQILCHFSFILFLIKASSSLLTESGWRQLMQKVSHEKQKTNSGAAVAVSVSVSSLSLSCQISQQKRHQTAVICSLIGLRSESISIKISNRRSLSKK